VVVPGRGRKLIGGTLRAELTRGEVVETILDGFFPTVDANARPAVARRAGLSTLGLPYATDAGMTRHLAAFLGRHAPEGKSFLHPSALLFNGGVTKSPMVRERIVNVINHWLSADGGNLVKVLEGDDPDLAVSRGAAYYAKARKGRGVRIKGGTARAYYVGIERAELAVPGIPPRLDAVCIAPFGMEEGTEVELPQELALVVGEHASFRFFASSTRRDDEVAAMVAPDAEDMVELPAIETTLEAEPGKAGQMVPVKLHSRVTEVGTLELSAVELGGSKRYKLEFDVRVS